MFSSKQGEPKSKPMTASTLITEELKVAEKEARVSLEETLPEV